MFPSQVSYKDLGGLANHLSTLLDATDSMTFYCEDLNRTFAVSYIDWEKDDAADDPKKAIDMSVHYHVFHCDMSATMSYEFTELGDVNDMINALFHVILDLKPCKECFHLTDLPEQYCQRCMTHKIRNEYIRVLRNETPPTHECAICLEEVYYSRLNCGHYFHKTCFIKQNPNSWFCIDTAPKIRCPMCRENISHDDKSNFFLC